MIFNWQRSAINRRISKSRQMILKPGLYESAGQIIVTHKKSDPPTHVRRRNRLLKFLTEKSNIDLKSYFRFVELKIFFWKRI